MPRAKTEQDIELAKALGMRLLLLRTSAGISQVDFARKIGVAQTTVSDWESGHLLIPTRHISNICNTFGISFSYFDTRVNGLLERFKMPAQV